jgi:hypothetical protein
MRDVYRPGQKQLAAAARKMARRHP